MMNLDLIQKLIRLANNNPNDNEANLAARKACKMLEDYKFPPSNTTPPKNTTYGDQTRNNGPSPFSSRPPDRPGFGFDSRLWEEFLKQAKAYKPHTKQEEFHKREEPYVSPKNVKEKRTLECCECHNKVETQFVGHPSVFICNPCQWTMYEKHKQGK